VNLHWQAMGWAAVGKWVGISLVDGSSDGQLYGSMAAATYHHTNKPDRYCYIRLIPHVMDICDAQIFLETQRRAYDAGMRQTDPDAPKGAAKQLIRPVTFEDRLKVLAVYRKAGFRGKEYSQ
jgi:hypothetical protein